MRKSAPNLNDLLRTSLARNTVQVRPGMTATQVNAALRRSAAGDAPVVTMPASEASRQDAPNLNQLLRQAAEESRAGVSGEGVA